MPLLLILRPLAVGDEGWWSVSGFQCGGELLGDCGREVVGGAGLVVGDLEAECVEELALDRGRGVAQSLGQVGDAAEQLPGVRSVRIG